jgi:hypothetical protein
MAVARNIARRGDGDGDPVRTASAVKRAAAAKEIGMGGSISTSQRNTTRRIID